jgi:divalent metal cation (Fe/Co/Zn/Cd) transporter
MDQTTDIDKENQIRRGRRLEYFTIVYNSLEGLIAIVAGLIAGSVSLVGFGIDSVIEITSGAALLWRLRPGMDPVQRESAERTSLRIVGACFLALAIYILYDSGFTLWHRDAPERSIPGIVLAAVSVVVMPLVARAKRRIAAAIASDAMRADSRQTDFCAYLSAILLAGLLLNALFGWWWADPIAALLMVPIIANEGLGDFRGKACADDCCCH